MCGPNQLVFFQCGPETPKGWTPLNYFKVRWKTELELFIPLRAGKLFPKGRALSLIRRQEH